MKYRKKPILIDATQFFVWMDKNDWPEGVEQRTISGNPDTIHGAQVEFFIKTLEGEFKVTNGDWIITGVAGEVYACKNAIFRATYQKEDGTSILAEPE